MSDETSPFLEDCDVLKVAEKFGMQVLRRARVIITDLAVIKENGLVKQSPDYGRIKDLLENGEIVQGAELSGVEYVMRPR
jgi:hypothetical protein